MSRASTGGLDRFVEAQAPVHAQALAELEAGSKRSHWMWFVFPQIAGLGRSGTAIFYAIESLEEARDYLDHPVLGPRLRSCSAAVLRHAGRRPEEIFGTVDALKLRSSMTLFEAAAQAPEPFAAVLDAFYAGERDGETLRLLAAR